ncbi:MAG TPA: adenylate/guanylate cyclase domain-containing protein [Parafilimonas sp.]|nr:adenylate/guanylate cyclase domain-containing protein [Parafilimonas sp.]
MPSTRQLAAIMFTDIVGYTALMGEDEKKAFEILRKNRQLQKPLIKKFNGRWIKELGDGVLASFTTVSDAVLCAVKIQDVCNSIDNLKLRIGIHLGEVVFEDDDVFGDGVNIASRIQALAPVGGIWVSEAVYNTIINKKNIEAKFVAEELLKNVKGPMRIYEVTINNAVLEDSKLRNKEEVQNKTTPQKSIAVLPFVDMSASHDQEYLGDGLAEEILNSIAHLKELKVAGRTSSFQFKGAKVDLREIGDKLGVSTVLEGSVRKQGNRLRVTVQLINVQDGFHLWSERYDRDMHDIFAIQDEIAFTITEQLKITLLEKDREKIMKTSTHNAEAYELYLKGRFHLYRRGSSILKGLQFSKQAITIDPSYALAHAGYAYANTLAAAYTFFPGRQVIKEVKQAAETAIKLDDTLGEAYFSLGYYYVCFEWNWEQSKKNFQKAIELNPGYVQARSLYAMICLGWVEGKFEEAEEQQRIAIKLEPLSAIDHADLAWTLLMAHKFEEALAIAKIGIELDNNSFLSHRVAGLAYMQLKRYEEAINTFTYLLKISDRHQHAVNSLIWAYCSSGNFQEARILMNELEKKSATEYVAGTYFGLSAAYLGDLDKAFHALEKACDDLDAHILTIKPAPYVPAALRNDPRFQNLLDRIDFPK